MSKTAIHTYESRHRQFLDAGKKLAKGDDMTKVSAAAVAEICGCTAPLVFSHFGNRDVLRDEVRKFVKTGKYPPAKKTEVKPAASSAPKPIKKPIKVVKAIKDKVAAKKSAAVTKRAVAKPLQVAIVGKPAAKKAAPKTKAKSAPGVSKTAASTSPVGSAVKVSSKLTPPAAPSNA